MSEPDEPLLPGGIWPQPPRGARPRGFKQRLSVGAAYLFYAGAVVCIGALVFLVRDLGGNHPVIASLGAATVFFVGAGVVLHVMGIADLPNLRFDREDGPPAP